MSSIFIAIEYPPLRAVGQVLIALLLSACAASSVDLRAQYVAPERYQGLSCPEIGTEGERVARRVAEISGIEYSATSGVASLVAQSIVVRWPTPLLATSEDVTAELAKLKGEFEALEKASALKRCSFSFKQLTG